MKHRQSRPQLSYPNHNPFPVNTASHRLSCWNKGSTIMFPNPPTVAGVLLNGGRSPPNPNFCKPAPSSGEGEEGQQAQASALSGNQWLYLESKLESGLWGKSSWVTGLSDCWLSRVADEHRPQPRDKCLGNPLPQSAFARMPAELRVSSTKGAHSTPPGMRKRGGEHEKTKGGKKRKDKADSIPNPLQSVRPAPKLGDLCIQPNLSHTLLRTFTA